MRNSIAKRLAAAITVAALLLAIPGTAFAQTEAVDPGAVETDRTAGFEQLQRRALQAIEKRLDAISDWTERVEGSDHLGADHRETLLAELTTTKRGLTALAEEIEGAATFSELGALVPKIVEDYWVFALVGPKVHLVVAADVTTHINGRLEDVASTIQAAISRIDEAGYDPTAAQAALDRMTDHLAAAAASAAPVPGTVLAIGPADMPEASTQLRDARAELESARDELRAAREAGRRAVEALREAVEP